MEVQLVHLFNNNTTLHLPLWDVPIWSVLQIQRKKHEAHTADRVDDAAPVAS